MSINNRSFSSPRLFAGLAFALLAGGSLLACGGDEAPAGPGPIPLDALRDELTNARCTWLARCGYTPDQKTCEATEGDSDETLQLLADAVLGRVTYDPAAARACVEALRARTCDDQTASRTAIDEACGGMFVGTVADGGPCLLHEECTGGLCDTSMCMGDACCLGTCKQEPAPAAIGADCSSTPCVAGAYCGNTGPNGEPPTCSALKDNGQPCDKIDACKDGQRCDVGGSDPKCFVLSKNGGSCNPNLEQPCLEFDDYCDPADSKCKQLPGAGAPCAPGDKCLVHAYCSTGTCKARPGIGEACMDGLVCLGTLACTEMKCTVIDSQDICAF
jgi:hypothetical protein